MFFTVVFFTVGARTPLSMPIFETMLVFQQSQATSILRRLSHEKFLTDPLTANPCNVAV